jgi:hypothetical protein
MFTNSLPGEARVPASPKQGGAISASVVDEGQQCNYCLINELHHEHAMSNGVWRKLATREKKTNAQLSQ